MTRPSANPRMAARLLVIAAGCGAIVFFTMRAMNAVALGVGIGLGALLFLRGMAAGGGLGNARRTGQSPADISTRQGICLAAAGVASGAIGHQPLFPMPFRVFYGVCLALACVIALTLAVRSLKKDAPDA